MIDLEIIKILEINQEDFKNIKSHIFKEHIASVLNIKCKGKIDQEINIRKIIKVLENNKRNTINLIHNHISRLKNIKRLGIIFCKIFKASTMIMRATYLFSCKKAIKMQIIRLILLQML